MTVAELQVEAATLEVSRTAWDIRTRLRAALLELWTAGELVNALAAREKAQQNVIRLLEARYEAGLIGRAQISREQIELERIRAALADASSSRFPARERLASAVGIPGWALENVRISLHEFNKLEVAIPDDAARRRALLNRSDVVVGLANYAIAEAALRLEIAKQYPDVTLNPGYNFDQGDDEWRLGLTMELPTMHQNQGPIAEADARRQEAAATFTTTQVRAITEVGIALADHRAAQENHTAALRALEPAKQQTQLVEARFAAGQVSRLDAAFARVQHAATEVAIVAARRKAQEALGGLEAALQIPANAMQIGPEDLVGDSLTP